MSAPSSSRSRRPPSRYRHRLRERPCLAHHRPDVNEEGVRPPAISRESLGNPNRGTAPSEIDRGPALPNLAPTWATSRLSLSFSALESGQDDEPDQEENQHREVDEDGHLTPYLW